VRVRGETVSTLLRTPVLTRGIRLGEVAGVLLDAEQPRILGLDVLCGDGANRFLPFSTAHRGTNGIEIASTLTLLELRFYRSRTRPLASVPELAHARVEADGALVLPLSAYR
jgi:hypothetical protein